MPATTSIAAKQYTLPYLEAFESRSSELPGLADLRRAAIERFGYLGFPTTHDEEWKYTNLAPFLKKLVAQAVSPALVRWEAKPVPPALTFINGRFVPEASATGVAYARPLPADHRIGCCAAFDNNAMVALNTAMFADGALIEIPDGAVLEQPIILRYVTVADTPVPTYPRNLIIAGRDSQAQIVEIFVGNRSSAPYFTNAVTELVAGDGAVLEHYKVQQEPEGVLHFGMLAARLGASANFTSHNIALGAGLARNEISVVLDGEGADCTLNGLYVTTGRQHTDNYTTLDHAKPHCTSHELYKGILDDHAQGVFHGRIIVRPEAQKTDAIQRNKNLLLSKDAVINTKPQLEIYADDVKCTHGATVGQVDQDAVFYLRSRGIPVEEARALLTHAFTADLVEKIKVEAVRDMVRNAMAKRLKGAAE